MPAVDLVNLASAQQWEPNLPAGISLDEIPAFVPIAQLEVEVVRVMLVPYEEDWYLYCLWHCKPSLLQATGDYSNGQILQQNYLITWCF